MNKIIENTYIKSRFISLDTKERLMRYLDSHNLIALSEEEQNSLPDSVLCVGNTYSEKFDSLVDKIETNRTLALFLERFDLELPNKYFSIFKIRDYFENESSILERILHSERSLDICEIENFAETMDKYNPPFIILDNLENELILKLNYLVEDREKQNPLKFPILLILYKDLGILEIRFSNLSEDYKKDDYVYKIFIDNVKTRVFDCFNIFLDNIDFRKVVANIKESEAENTSSYREHLEGEYNSSAVLKSFDDGEDKHIMPILGQLKKWMREDPRLSIHPEVIECLNEFIEEINSKNDFVHSCISWLDEGNEIEFVISFKHEYKGSNYSLMKMMKFRNNQYKNMEERKNVTRNIIRYSDLSETIE